MAAVCRTFLPALTALALLTPAAAASERVNALDGSELHGWDKYFLQRTIPIMPQPGLGPISMPVTTASASAQMWFDQGLAQLFGFAHEDAIYSFRNALDADPHLAMAEWGISYAYGSNINLLADIARAREAFRHEQNARRIAIYASPRERDYIEALSVRYDPEHMPLGRLDRRPLDFLYFDRMLALRAKYPDDLHAATFAEEAGLDLYPWNQWDRDGRARPHTRQVIAILEDVLRRDPHHVGAQHYLVHAVEASPDPDRARVAAETMQVDAPGQPHLVHAASHIYARDGDWAAGMVSGEDAERQDAIYLQRNGTNNLYTIAHGSHNIHFQASVMSMGGRHLDAVANAHKLRLRVGRFLDDLRGLEYYEFYETLMRTRFADWDGVFAMPAPPDYLLGSQAIRHYARGTAYAKRGHENLAGRELAALIFLRSRIAARKPEYPDFNLNAARNVLSVGIHVLAARIRWYRGNREQAIRLFAEAANLEDDLHYDEPPPWYYPSGESLGAALLLDGRPRLAQREFETVLRRFPGDGWALFGLTEALRAQGAPAEQVAKAAREFAHAWRLSDTPLTRIDQLL